MVPVPILWQRALWRVLARNKLHANGNHLYEACFVNVVGLTDNLDARLWHIRLLPRLVKKIHFADENLTIDALRHNVICSKPHIDFGRNATNEFYALCNTHYAIRKTRNLNYLSYATDQTLPKPQTI